MALLPVVAMDAGGATLRASRVTPSSNHPQLSKKKRSSADVPAAAPPSTAPWLLANQIATTTSSSVPLMGAALTDREKQRVRLHYTRPVERGYCVNWNVASELWAHLFSDRMLDVTPSDHALLTTSPLLAPSVTLETMDEVAFEEFGFASLARVPAAEMCVLSYAEHTRRQEAEQAVACLPKNKRRRGPTSDQGHETESGDAGTDDGGDADVPFHRSSCQLVVDSGYSFTHIVPVVDGAVVQDAVIRINVGGKLLTNYLKEVVSFRQWNVMDDTRIINELKEALCYCSLDFDDEMHKLHTDKASKRHWELPDFVHTFHGRLRTEDDAVENEGDNDAQVLEMGVEMIAAPEVLFHPSDIGLNQAGLAEAIMQSVGRCPPCLRSSLLANILLVGGTTKFTHFTDRLESDLRPLVPTDWDIKMYAPEDPILAAWNGCTLLANQQDQLAARSVSKAEYEEHGSNICRSRFR